MQARLSTLLQACWHTFTPEALRSLQLDQPLSIFGCWKEYEEPIHIILATLTGVLRNRLDNVGFPSRGDSSCGKAV